MNETLPQPLTIPRWQRQLLPGNAVDARGAKRSLRDWMVDAHLLAFALLAGGGSIAELWNDSSNSVRAAQVALGLIACGLLWWRRRYPFRVAVAVLALSVLSLGAAGAALVVVFNSAIRLSPRALTWISIAATATTATTPRLYETDAVWSDVLAAIIFVLIFVGWGLFVRVQRDLVAALHVQAELAEHERAAEVERARDAERRRIAREMHDVLAHRISMVSLHAGALEHRGASATSAEVTQVAGVIRDSAVAAMEELRGVIGVLRQDTADGASIEPPQPTFASIPALIDENRATGMDVTADMDELPASDDSRRAVELAAYRVVQEGLTNARKHAPGAAVHVAFGVREQQLVVTVRSDAPRLAAAPAMPSSGAGLVGLTERLVLVDGTLTHGSDRAGRFVLTATMPIGDAR